MFLNFHLWSFKNILVSTCKFLLFWEWVIAPLKSLKKITTITCRHDLEQQHFLNKKPIFVQIICAYCSCLFTANNLRSKDVQKSVKNPYYTSCLNLVLNYKSKVNEFLKDSKIYLEKGTFTMKNGSLEVLNVYLDFEVFHK